MSYKKAKNKTKMSGMIEPDKTRSQCLPPLIWSAVKTDLSTSAVSLWCAGSCLSFTFEHQQIKKKREREEHSPGEENVEKGVREVQKVNCFSFPSFHVGRNV